MTDLPPWIGSVWSLLAAIGVGAVVLAGGARLAVAFILDVRFQDGSQPLAAREDRIESPLEDGAAWSWEVVLPLDEGSAVDTDGLQCRIVQVQLATVDNGD